MSKNRTPTVLNMKLKAKSPEEDQDKKRVRKDATQKTEEHVSRLRTNLWKTETDGETWSKGWR
jgi:hypothetical protein